jgi:hypothetical protein
VAVVDAWYWLLDHAEEPFARVPLPDGESLSRRRVDTFEGKLAWVAGEPKTALLASTSEQQEAMLASPLAIPSGARCPSASLRRYTSAGTPNGLRSSASGCASARTASAIPV